MGSQPEPSDVIRRGKFQEWDNRRRAERSDGEANRARGSQLDLHGFIQLSGLGTDVEPASEGGVKPVSLVARVSRPTSKIGGVASLSEGKIMTDRTGGVGKSPSNGEGRFEKRARGAVSLRRCFDLIHEPGDVFSQGETKKTPGLFF